MSKDGPIFITALFKTTFYQKKTRGNVLIKIYAVLLFEMWQEVIIVSLSSLVDGYNALLAVPSALRRLCKLMCNVSESLYHVSAHLPRSANVTPLFISSTDSQKQTVLV